MAQSIGISVPVTIDIGEEKDVSFYPLGMSEWKQMELSLLHRRRERHIKAVSETTGSLDDDFRRELIREAVNEAKLIELTPVEVRVEKKTDGIVDIDSDGKTIMVTTQMDAVNAWVEQTYEGKMFAIWLSLKRGRPEITEQEVSDLLMADGVHGMEQAFNAMLSASGMADEAKNEDGPSSKRKAKKGQ